ncbi:zinc finger protein [Clarias magur]|uniref:Zinc finger protein n=1 Tax=Clarias magur TaxID=1594786 RepID=A0A8J4UN57_CLAMG|nr:zinc finger protein [Clarias magur]
MTTSAAAGHGRGPLFVLQSHSERDVHPGAYALVHLRRSQSSWTLGFACKPAEHRVVRETGKDLARHICSESSQEMITNAEPAEDGALAGSSAVEDGWFGNNSDSPSTSSYGDVQDDLRVSPEDGARPDRAASARSPSGCATPNQRVSLELLGLDARTLSSQDMSLVSSVSLSSMVSSLYGDSAHGLSKPLSSNLRRLLESGSVKIESGELIGRGLGRGAESPPAGLTLSPSSHHAQQLSALARRLANSSNNGVSSASTSPASVPVVKQEPGDPFGPAEPASSGNTSFVWVGMADKWPPTGSLSPDSAIQKLKAAANAVLQDKNSTSLSSSSSSSSVTSSSSSSSSSSSVPPLGGDPVRFDSFASPFSSQSASSTLAALSKKVSERSQQQQQPPPQQQQQQQQQQQPSAAPFLSLVSMTSSAALLKEVAARAAGNMLADKKEPQLATANTEDSKAQLDRNHKAPTPNQNMELLLPAAPKGRTKPSSQAGSPEDSGKPFQCPVCGLVIKRKSYWKRHMVIHTGLKSHQCPLCPFRCARKDNLKSHMKVHQHQDRGETFQCDLCPFTSSRHFSLKLHMRCHQHFPRSELKVKEEPFTDAEEAEAERASGTGTSPSPSLCQAPGEPSSNHAHIKEEPQDVALTPPFPPGRERPGSSSSSLDLPRISASPPGPGPGTPAASLFSPDISTKTATDLLMKLSGS